MKDIFLTKYLHHLRTIIVYYNLTMSSPVTQTEQIVLVAENATKTRQPTLPDKYGKFIQFAYYMMENLLGEDFQMDNEAYFEKIKLFGTVGEQQALVQGFLDRTKDNKKTIRKLISDRKKEQAKANKPPKKSRAKTTTTADGETNASKPSRKKTTKAVVNAQDELLNDLVQLARADTPIVSAPTVAEVEVKQTISSTEEAPKTPKKTKSSNTDKPPNTPKKASKKATAVAPANSQETSE